MPQNFGAGYAPSLSPQQPAKASEPLSHWTGPHSIPALAGLVVFPGDALLLSSREAAAWERLSLAIHRLPTNRLQYSLVKRVLDILVVIAILPCLMPLLLIVALMVKISSPGPIFYRQTRVGRFGRQFTLWKFRSMQVNGDAILQKHLATRPEAVAEWAETRKLRSDPRVTAVGRILRRLSLDELPQFLNVLNGTMSLVGPRPIVTAERENYGDAYLYYTSAKPGLSGLWQVSGRSDLSYEQRVLLDAEYIERWNIGLDVQILWRTAGVVWGAKGAV